MIEEMVKLSVAIWQCIYITICVQLFAYTQFLRSHDIDACSYLKGTSVKLDNKDVVFGTSLGNFLLCLGTGYSCLIPYSSIKTLWTLKSDLNRHLNITLLHQRGAKDAVIPWLKCSPCIYAA